MNGPGVAPRLLAYLSGGPHSGRRARRLLGVAQAMILLAGLLLPALIAGPAMANSHHSTATLTVAKVCAPTTDTGRFNLRIDGVTVRSNAACGSTKTVTVSTGRHSVSETAGSGTNLSNYAATFGSTCPGGSITLAANKSATCTITNTRKPPPGTATLTVAKVCAPTTDTGRFNLQVDGKTVLANAACGSTKTVTVTTGHHAVSETSGSGTSLSSYSAAIGGACATSGSITLAANQSATCTITNTRRPTLTVVKACVPDPTTGEFDLLIDGIDRGDVSCAAHGIRTTHPVVLGVGPHTIGEEADGTTVLSAYVATYSANCAGATITLVAGQNAVCTITNTLRTPTLAVAKTDNGPWTIGQAGAKYTITVSNSGTKPTSGTITVSDTLPSGVTLGGTPSGTGWNCSGASGNASFSCTSTTVIAASGSGNPISVPVLIGATTAQGTNSITNTASAFGGGDPAHSASATAISGSDQTTVAASTVDLQITKTDGVDEVVSGDSTIYTIVVTNAGPANVTGAKVVDPSPRDRFTWTAVGTGGASGFTADSSVDPFPDDIDDTVNMPAGSTITYTVTRSTLTADIGSIVNTATVTAPAGITETNLVNNSATDTDSLTQPSDLSITKTDGVESVSPGDQVTYTIVVSNPSQFPVGVTVTDTVPASLTNVTWTATETLCLCFPTSGSGSINESGEIVSGGSITITLVGTVAADASGSIVNTATIDEAGVDPNPANNSATDTDTVVGRVIALAFTNLDGEPGYNPGEDVLIAELVDTDLSGSASAGDTVITNQYPTSLAAPFSFGNFTVTSHTLTSASATSSLVSVSGPDGTFKWHSDNGFEGYEEYILDSSTNFAGFLDNARPGVDEIGVDTTSPSRPDTAVPVDLNGFADADDPFVDVIITP